MLFGLSLTKFMVLLSLGFLLFGVPLMGLLVSLRERRQRGVDRSSREKTASPGDLLSE